MLNKHQQHVGVQVLKGFYVQKYIYIQNVMMSHQCLTCKSKRIPSFTILFVLSKKSVSLGDILWNTTF